MRRISKVVAVGLLCGLVAGGGRGAVAAGAASAGPAGRIDINVASAAELEALPGIGPAKAQAIIEHRKTAPFANPEDLRDVQGIGDRLWDQLKDRISVGSTAKASSGRGG